MSTTASVPIPSDSESSRQQQILTAFPTLLEKTEKQMGILLGTVNRLEDLVCENKSISEGSEVPPEVRKKAIETTILALHQIDIVIDDMKRWNADEGALETTYKRYLNTAADFADANLIHKRQDSLPHIRYKAKLYRVEINDWIACYVEGKTEHAIGRGPTVSDALKDFDVHFLKGFEPVKLPAVTPKRKSSPRKALKK